MFKFRVQIPGVGVIVHDGGEEVTAKVHDGHLLLATRSQPELAGYAPGGWIRFWRLPQDDDGALGDA